ncbi:FecCD family ABC transporter permease [Paenibacillus yanchengensis]|uniref:FecCD family ABC transporter permease n=1 Tax=Paenibacillus yanchengensis TaxID=2035833 RepID=A0ABW4YNG5_9BACL
MIDTTKVSRSQTIQRPYVSSRPIAATLILTVGIIFLLVSIAISISFGAADISLRDVWQAVFHFDNTIHDQQVIQELRLPRVLGALLVGASFAVAGALMQGMTRNPLADSGLLGLNSGAALAMAVCFALFPDTSYIWLMVFSFIGAAVGAAIVFGVGTMPRGGLTPVRLVLAGAAISILFSAISEGISLYFRIGQDLAFWFAGGVSGTRWSHLTVLAPVVIIAIGCAVALSRSITLLSLGDEIATGLGQKTQLIKLSGTLLVLVLAGAAVSVIGPVGFVGLIIPHLTRYIVGVDYRFIIPCSAVLGALLMVWADFAARIINPPYETPVGALISLIGVPFFLYLSRKERRTL